MCVKILAYGADGTPNAMNAAWGGISEEAQLSMCISEGHKTTANILARKAFTVSMATAEQVVACDYVGIESGNQVANKLEKAGWHTVRSEFVDAPLIQELPMAVECRLVSYDPETCRMVGGDRQRERRRIRTGGGRQDRPGKIAAHRL